jgi:hypothetical protein
LNKEETDLIVQKLNTLIKITMASAFKGSSKEEKILALLEIGIPRLEIAEIIGCNVQYVDNVKSQARKSRIKKKQKDVTEAKVVDKTVEN